MTEFYDFTDSHYYRLLQDSVKVYCWKLELLDYQDAVIKEIVIDLDTSNSGSLTFSNQQGSCRNCSFTFTNPDYNYSIIENNPFWDRRRFKIYIGIKSEGSVYWFSKGVYITQNATVDFHTITVQAVDKYGLLDGTLKVLPAFLKTTFMAGSKIGDIIRQILLQDIGNGFVLDAVEPIIDPDIANALLYRDYEMAVGSYYGDFLSELMNGYGCDIYYDAMGRLIVKRVFNDDIPYWYFYQSVAYSFSDDEIHYQEPNTSYDFDGVNYIIVETDNTATANASYELGNHNPQSPVCIEKIGYKAYDDGRPVYISSGDTSIDTPERKCKEYAEYMLLKQTCNTVTKSFNAPIIPHLDTRQTIRITDKTTLEDGVVFLVTGLTIPFGQPENSTITATNIQWLLTDVESTSLTSERHNPATAKYTVSFSGTVKNADGNNLTFSSVTDYAGGVVVLPTSGKGKGLGNADLGFFNGVNVFAGWQDNEFGYNHYSGSIYTIPEQDVVMSANWQSGNVGIIKCNISSAGSYTVKAMDSQGSASTPRGFVYLKTAGKYLPSEQSLFSGKTVAASAGQYELDYVYPDNTDFVITGNFDGNTILSEATEIDLSGLTSVYGMYAGALSETQKLSKLRLPPHLTTIQGTNTMKDCVMLTDFEWPTSQLTITSPQNFMSYAGVLATPVEEHEIPNNVTFSFGSEQNPKLLEGFAMAETLRMYCTVTSSVNNYPELSVSSPVDRLYLVGNQHYSSLDIANSLSYVYVKATVTVDNWTNFGQGANWDATLFYAGTSMSGMFNGYLGSTITLTANDVTTITNSFNGTGVNLASVEIPSHTTTITSSFNGTRQTSISIPDLVTDITGSFQGNNDMQTLYIGAGLSTISFLNPGVVALAQITVSGDNQYYSSKDNSIYSKDKSILYFSAMTGITDLTVDSATTQLSMYTAWMPSLNTLTLPASLTTIDSSAINPNISIGTFTILNPTLDLTNAPYANVSKIQGYAGSTAETFAQTHSITFETIT